MKKYLLILFVFFGLQAQAQFIGNDCDSIGISINPASTSTTLLLDGTVGNINGTVTNWNWIIFNNLGVILVDSVQNVSVNPANTIDTLTVFLSPSINSNGIIASCSFTGTIYYNGSSWVVTLSSNITGNGSIGIGPGGIGSMSSHCDSINVVVDPMSTSTSVILNADATTLPGIVTSWFWDIYDYNGFVQTSSTQSVNFTASTTDTLMVFLETTIDINGSVFVCMHFGSVYYDGSNWVFTSAYLPLGPIIPGGGAGIGNISAVCDSVSISVNSSSTYSNITFDGTISGANTYILDYYWEVFDQAGNMFVDSTQSISFINSNPSDTFAVFLTTVIDDGVSIFSCMAFDMLVFGNNGWVSMRVGGSATGIEDINSFLENRKLLKVVDVLGRETKQVKNTPMFYIYNDGTVEQKMIIE